jgi:hypothetical protein
MTPKPSRFDRQLSDLFAARVRWADRDQMERYLRQYPAALPLLEPAVQVVVREFEPPAEIIVAVDTDPELVDPCLLVVVRVQGGLDAARDRDVRLAALRQLSVFKKPAAKRVLLLTTDNARPRTALGSIQRIRGGGDT